MGGIGSGNRWQSGGPTTSSMRHIDVRWMAREGMLNEGRRGSIAWSTNGSETGRIDYRTGADHVRLLYRHREGDAGDWVSEDYPVRLTRTPCNMGGARAWFLCPARGCGRRVAILYGGAIFACRKCYRLSYPSQRQSDADRATDMAWNMRRKLGWPGDLFDGPNWGRPKGMHHTTYARHLARYEKLETRTFAGHVQMLAEMRALEVKLRERRNRKGKRR